MTCEQGGRRRWLTRLVVRQRGLLLALATPSLRAAFTALPVFGAALLVAAPAAADSTAVLVGTVVDASSKKPVADVVVTVTSPGLQSEQVVVTDSSGTFRVPDLPPGQYLLRLEKEGFKPFARDAIGLRADSTIRLNAQLLPEQLKAEEVVVVGHPPTVDVGSSSVGGSIPSEFTRRIPVAPPGAKGSATRSFEAVAEVTPGAQFDTYGVSINGASSPENRYVLDGLTINTPNLGLVGTPLSMEFIKEVNVMSGGYMPEYGRATGGILSVVTKSGSNQFHGSVFSSLTPGGLEGRREPVRRNGTTISTDTSLSHMADIGFDLGGPIIQDKLWFYAGLDISRTRYKLNRTLNRNVLDAAGNPVVVDGFNVTEPLPGTDQSFNADAQNIQAIAKLDYAVNRDNQLSLEFITNPYHSGGNGTFGINPISGLPEIGNSFTQTTIPLNGPYSALAHQYMGSSTNAILKWSTAWNDKHMLLDTSLGWFHGTGGRTAGDGSKLGSTTGAASIPNVWWLGSHSITDFESVPNPALCDGPMGTRCPVNDYHTGGAEFLDEQTFNRYQLRSVLTSFFQGAGHHVVKAGVDGALDTYKHLKGYAGGRDLVEDASGGYYYEGRQYGYLTGPDQPVILPSLSASTQSVIVGGFLQDSWNIMDQVTVNFGLRYDAQFMYAADGSRSLSFPFELSPRLGAIYDFTHEGRSKLYANYARYFEAVPLDIVDRLGSGGEPYVVSAYGADACDPRDPARPCNSNGQRLAAGSAPNQVWLPMNQGKVPVDPDLKRFSTDETVLGGEYEIMKNGRLGLSYTKRWVNNAIEDMSRDEGQTFFVGNPGSGIAKDFPKAERNYDALTLYFQKVFADQWLAQASYTLSYLRGNYAGLFRPEDGQFNPNSNTDFDLRSLTVNRYGALPGDQRHSFKLFGARDFSLGGGNDIVSGLGLRAHSGQPTSYLGAHPSAYGPDQVFILPRGEGDRLPWNYSVDLRLGYSYHLDKDKTIEATLDVFNLFNFQGVTARDQRYTVSAVQPITNGGGVGQLTNADGTAFSGTVNPNFGNPSAYQPPRIFRFGLRSTF